MSNKSKGAEFERYVKKKLEEEGNHVIRNRQQLMFGKFRGIMQFPDLVAIPPLDSNCVLKELNRPFFVECKVNKYLKPEEKQKFKELLKYGTTFVCWKIKINNRIKCVFGNPDDYAEVFRL